MKPTTRFSPAIHAVTCVALFFSLCDASVGADVTSDAGRVSQVSTRTTDASFTLGAMGAGDADFPVSFSLKRWSTLIINVSLRGVANSEREWGLHCAGSTVTCEPLGSFERFHAGERNTLSFTVVARDVPPGPGTVNLFIAANCPIANACVGSEELTVERLAVVVQAANQ